MPVFQPLSGIYEPSAVQQLADGRVLVVEDEKKHPFSLLTLGLDGTVSSTALSRDSLDDDDPFRKLDDLEGLTTDRAGYLYAITSHSRDGEGEEKKSRDKLVRFRVEGDRVVAPIVSLGLKPALVASHPCLAAAAAVLDVKNEGGLNIEALELSADQRHLLIGFRSPLLNNRAIIAGVENHAAIFNDGASPQIAQQLITLDLAGHGIRGMAYVPALAGYLIISGPVARERVQFQLWFWSGHPHDAARRASVDGLHGFEHAEGASAAIIDGQQRIIIVSDDGDRKMERCAHFLLLEPGQLQMAS